MMSRVSSSALIASSICLTTAAWATDYDGAFAEARRLESAGQYAAAADVLAPLGETYPQDYPLFLQLGWLRFQAGQYEAAEAAYRVAHALSDGSVESSLGLGWTLLRLERTEQARPYFVEAQLKAPDNASAAEGLAAATRIDAARPAWRYGLYVGALGELYVDPATSTATPGLGGAAALALRFGAAAGTLSYAYLQYATSDGGAGAGPGPGGRRTLTAAAGRHQVYASLAWAPRAWGLSLHGGGLLSDELTSGYALGGVARWSPFGDLRLEGSFGRFDDDVRVARVAPNWTLPLGRVLFVTPGAAFQASDGRTFWSGALEVGARTARLTARVGGSYGQAYRSVLWAIPSIETVDGIGRLRAYATLDMPLGGAWGVHADYAFSLYDPLAGTTDRFMGHGASLGIHKSVW